MSIASDPPRTEPVPMSIASDPPLAVTMEFSDQREGTAEPQEAVTEPPELEIGQGLDLQALKQFEPTVQIAKALEGQGPKDFPHPAPPSRAARLLAWSIDLALLAACAAAHVWLATAILGPARLAPHGTGSPDYWLDLLLAPRLPLLWAALAGCLALAYSWLFAMLGGRTPGLAVARLKLVTASGAPPTPAKALTRAALSLASAAGLLGFALALFDERGQTLHDKLTRTRVVAE